MTSVRTDQPRPRPSCTCSTPAISPTGTSAPGGPTWARCWRCWATTRIEAFIDAVVPEEIRLRRPLALPPGRSEREVLQALRGLAGMNRVFRSYIGMGYAGCFTPPVIQRNVLENPGWYTAYTPYQAEIAQGRLEALLNFQTMVSDLTGLEIANASLLDEATAAAEAMALDARAVSKTSGEPVYLVDEHCHPQTIEVVQTRAEARGIKVVVGEPETFAFEPGVIGALVQYPATDGAVRDFRALCRAGARRRRAGHRGDRSAERSPCSRRRANGAPTSPSATASASACRWATAGRTPRSSPRGTSTSASCPGASSASPRDRDGRPALRMALQTREQHIRRDKATSNVCTAQVLLAVMASMYAVYHGPAGSAASPSGCTPATVVLANALRRLGYRVVHEAYFDTLCVEVPEWALPRLLDAARAREINLRPLPPTRLCIALDETVTLGDLADLIAVFSLNEALPFMLDDIGIKSERAIPRGAGADDVLPDASGLPPAPLRDRDAALHQAARGARPLAHLRDDPARLLHDEAERHHRDDAGDAGRSSTGCIRSRRATRPRATSSCSASWSTSWRRSPASPPCRCSPTPARRASTPACW